VAVAPPRLHKGTAGAGGMFEVPRQQGASRRRQRSVTVTRCLGLRLQGGLRPAHVNGSRHHREDPSTDRVAETAMHVARYGAPAGAGKRQERGKLTACLLRGVGTDWRTASVTSAGGDTQGRSGNSVRAPFAMVGADPVNNRGVLELRIPRGLVPYSGRGRTVVSDRGRHRVAFDH
jgi:hypothetical protein